MHFGADRWACPFRFASGMLREEPSPLFWDRLLTAQTCGVLAIANNLSIRSARGASCSAKLNRS